MQGYLPKEHKMSEQLSPIASVPSLIYSRDHLPIHKCHGGPLLCRYVTLDLCRAFPENCTMRSLRTEAVTYRYLCLLVPSSKYLLNENLSEAAYQGQEEVVPLGRFYPQCSLPVPA